MVQSEDELPSEEELPEVMIRLTGCRSVTLAIARAAAGLRLVIRSPNSLVLPPASRRRRPARGTEMRRTRVSRAAALQSGWQ